LVVDYSLTGNTHLVAEAIARGCGADLERLRDVRSRHGLWGYIRSAREALKERSAEIRRPKYDPADYELIVLGSPVWVGHVSSPMRRYLADNAGKFGRIAVFVSEGGRGGPKVLAEMAALAQRSPVARLELRASELGDDLVHKVSDFVDRVRKAAGPAPAKKKVA
ncbi:MAG: flavodoxin family protein, partial [Croceibacterium sp.]